VTSYLYSGLNMFQILSNFELLRKFYSYVADCTLFYYISVCVTYMSHWAVR